MLKSTRDDSVLVNTLYRENSVYIFIIYSQPHVHPKVYRNKAPFSPFVQNPCLCP